MIRGKKTQIDKLKREDVDKMQFWGVHKDPLFFCYSFPKMDSREMDRWYNIKRHSLLRKSFAIYGEENNLIGYISLRDIKWFRRISELGIVFDPNYLNRGYGTDSLRAFLVYYFEEMRMSRLNLKVSEFNVRGQRCYEKCGFKVTGLGYDEFEDQYLPVFEDDTLKDFRCFFKKEGNILKCRYIHMSITKEDYQQNKQSYPHYPPNTCA